MARRSSTNRTTDPEVMAVSAGIGIVVLIGGTTNPLPSIRHFPRASQADEETARRSGKIFPDRWMLFARPRFQHMRIVAISKFSL